MCADSEVMRHFPYVLTREESEAQVERFVRHWEQCGFGLWAVEEKAYGAFIGFVGLRYNEEWSEGEHKTEVGWRLDRAWWNRGLATEGALASLGYGFEVLELERIISFTVPENAASRRVMEKCDLVQQGETRWKGLDHVWYALDRRYWEAAEN
jgi:ribosomal-protein-alanine N-acetyltransferase